ncbi:MAG TPA: hypothetical protein ENN10_02220 [Actinobacteria bacterium]|nr:hypothetical protein [Actinomycetota bacterium]
MQTEQCDVVKKDRVDFVKNTFEAIKARAHYLRNWRLFYKWSIAAGLVGVLGGIGALLFSYTLDAITRSSTRWQRLYPISV